MDRSKWEYKKLGEVATFERGLTYSKNDESDSSTKGVLRSNNIDLDSHQLVFDEIKYLNESFEIPKSKKLVKDSIFICMSNGSKAHLGKVAYVDKDYDYAFGGFMGMIKPHNIYPKYLFYYFLSKEYRDGLEQIGKGANINNLRFAQLANFIIPDPSKDDQQRIVAELDCLNEMIALKQKQLKEFDKLAQSIFYDMFGDPVHNEKGWDCSLFGECIKLRSGDGLSAKDIIPGEYSVYGGNGIVGYHNQFNLDEDAIIIGRVGALCGNVRNVKGCIFVTDNAFILSQLISFDNVFLKNLLEILNLRKFAREAMQPVISNKTLKDVNIILPPLALQQQFAEKIQAIEAQKELVKQSIAETQQLLDSRMDYYFN